LKLREERAKPGETVWAVGHPSLQPKTVTSGEAVGYDDKQVAMGIIGFDGFKRDDCKYVNERMVVISNPDDAAGGHSSWAYTVPYGTAPYEPDSRNLPKKFTVCLEDHLALITTVLVWHGSSGSPLVDDAGKVVGVVYALTDDGVFWGQSVSLMDLRRLLDKY
jgi:hypothetical protein